MITVSDIELNRSARRRIDSRNTAKRLNVTQRRVRQLAVRGDLPGHREPGRKLWWFDPKDVDAYHIEMIRRHEEGF